MMLRSLSFLCLFFLQSCQYQADMKAEKQQATQKRNKAAVSNIQLGMAYLNSGDRPRAKKKFITALDSAPDLPEANAAMAWFLDRTGDIKKAENFYRKAVALAPESGAQLNNYGVFLCEQGNYQLAEQYFLKAVRDAHYYNTAKVYENAGICASEISDLPKATAYFVKALEQDPQRKQVLRELISVEIKQHHKDKALVYQNRYKKQFPGDTKFTGTTGAKNEYYERRNG